MATENPMRIMESSRTGKWATSRGSASFASPVSSVVAADELGMLHRDHNIHRDQSNIAPGRSGSAPPSMEGSFAAFGNLINQQYSSSSAVFSSGLENSLSVDQLQADSSYSTHYRSNIDLKERFSPSNFTRENIHLAHRSGISRHDWRLPSEDGSGSGSLYPARKFLSTHEEEPEDDRAESSSIMIGQHTFSSSGRHKSLVDLIQEDFPRTPSPIFSQTHSSSHVEEPFNNDIQSLSLDALSLKASKTTEPNTGSDTIEISHGSTATQDPSAGSDPLSPIKDELTSNNGCSTNFVGDDAIILDGPENLNKDEDGQDGQQLGFDQQNEFDPQYSYSQHSAGYHVPGFQQQGTGQGENINGMDKVSHGHHNMTSVEMHPPLHASGVHPPLYSAAAAYMASGSSYYPNFSASGLYAPQYSGYALNSSFVPPYLTGYPPHTGFSLHFNANSGQSFSGQNVGSPTGEGISKGSVMQNSDRFYGHHGLAMHPTFPDPLSMRYFQQLVQDPYSVPVQYSHYPPPGMIGSQVDSFALRNDPTAAAYTGDQKFQLPPSGSISIPSPREIGLPSSNYLSSPTGLGFVPQSPLGSPIMPGSPISGTGRKYNSGFSQTSPRNAGGYAKWQGQRGVDSINDHRKHSFLEELKASGAQRIDLADIFGRIAEFSIDQHGSRFIQQKLENCSVEEKESVFREILPHAPKLITDVFGNYVIQKFFEHGSYEQRKELASQLSGHMLPLSLQMYGCRVIQKALEVIELEQKTKLVLELDGNVIRCVRDQNGNHVIQKCIECLPTAKLDFIISAFEGQVAMLSTHPYGCRVIQRVLEHCSDDLQCRSIVNEILGSTNDLAQDQYGNYVIQHVLERGKPFERSQIISKLSGQIVHMSQHKYASNVVEKCLEFGDSAERELLIEEILMQSDDLLAMMKDQFANYVVQKIIDIGNNRQRETLFSQIQVHIDALKKYTYGKHIVTRFEQLSGEGNGTSDP